MQVHVLLAEDEPLVALTMGELLTDAGYRVTVAHDGIEAIDAYAADPADILVTDVRMPRLDGLGLMVRLRETNPNLPVVVTTGYALPGMIVVPAAIISARRSERRAALSCPALAAGMPNSCPPWAALCNPTRAWDWV